MVPVLHQQQFLVTESSLRHVHISWLKNALESTTGQFLYPTSTNLERSLYTHGSCSPPTFSCHRVQLEHVSCLKNGLESTTGQFLHSKLTNLERSLNTWFLFSTINSFLSQSSLRHVHISCLKNALESTTGQFLSSTSTNLDGSCSPPTTVSCNRVQFLP